MPREPYDEKDLRKELSEFRERFPKLADDDLFVLWFLRAFVTDDETAAAKALCGGPGDKSIDAVFIDDDTRSIFVIQGKYRQKLGGKAENRTDVETFAFLARSICGDSDEFASLCADIAPEVERALKGARERVVKRGYRLQLLYVTTGSCSEYLRGSAERIVRPADGAAAIQIIDGRQVMLMFADYLDGVAPPVPSLDLEIESGRGRGVSGILQRFDPDTDIESWVFSISDATVSDLFKAAGIRLFARNVRGFLGSTEINRGMQETLAKEPEFFWYYNNGITIVCDAASRVSSGGRDVIRVTNPQVINGQQTTRTLASSSGRGRASVLVRVIRVPRQAARGPSTFENLVSRIVSATNWQNAIRPSDLMSNDRIQIELDRQLRKMGYFYLRKRQKKSEARRLAGGRHFYIVRKEDIAQAVAACDHDPAVVREGKERLFEERWYSQIFPTAAPAFYLNRYWLMRQVSYVARGYPERAYAKWVVLNFTWRHIGPLLASNERRERFWIACLKNSAVLTPLCMAIEAVYKAALRFFRRERGIGETAQDVSTFFKRKGLHKDFGRFWRGSGNMLRGPFLKKWRRFEEKIKLDPDALE
jgi:AIPR protein